MPIDAKLPVSSYVVEDQKCREIGHLNVTICRKSEVVVAAYAIENGLDFPIQVWRFFQQTLENRYVYILSSECEDASLEDIEKQFFSIRSVADWAIEKAFP